MSIEIKKIHELHKHYEMIYRGSTLKVPLILYEKEYGYDLMVFNPYNAVKIKYKNAWNWKRFNFEKGEIIEQKYLYESGEAHSVSYNIRCEKETEDIEEICKNIALTKYLPFCYNLEQVRLGKQKFAIYEKEVSTKKITIEDNTFYYRIFNEVFDYVSDNVYPFGVYEKYKTYTYFYKSDTALNYHYWTKEYKQIVYHVFPDTPLFKIAKDITKDEINIEQIKEKFNLFK